MHENSQADRNLLVGILALQMEFVTQSQLIEAMQRWVLEKEKPIEALLFEADVINAETREFLKSIAQQHLKLHSDSVQKSLASLSSLGSLGDELLELQDSAVEQTIRSIAATKKLDAPSEPIDATIAFAQKVAKADAQNRFRILRPHARGGLGIVSVAEDTELHREVALKEIQERYSHDANSRTRFLIEAEITGRLEHPSIVPVYSLGQSNNGSPFYVMRFIRGDSMSEAIASLHSKAAKFSDDDRRLRLRQLIGRLIDVCNAIEYAHSRGILHRDLKPGNIMLGKYGETLVVDWGLAKTIGKSGKFESSEEATVVPTSGDGSSATILGSVVGTLAYMSPEQAAGRIDELGPTADVYCLGATLYCILTGHAPIEKATNELMLQAIQAAKYPPIDEVAGNIDPALRAICKKAMALKVSNRYPSSAQLAADLELWLADEPTTAYSEPLGRRLRRLIVKHQTAATVIASAAGVGLIALFVIAILVTESNRKLTRANDEIRRANETILEKQTQLSDTRDGYRELAFEMLDSAENQLRQIPGIDTFRTQVMDQSFDTLVQLHAQDPSDEKLTRSLFHTARLSANQLARTDDAPGGETRMLLSIQLQEELLEQTDERAQLIYSLAESYKDLVGIQRRCSKLDEAQESFEKIPALLEQLNALNDPKYGGPRTEAECYMAGISLYEELGETDKALEIARKCASNYRELLATDQATVIDRLLYSFAEASVGELLIDQNNLEEAASALDQGEIWAERNLQENPGNRNFQYASASIHKLRAELDQRADEVNEETLETIEKATAIYLDINTKNPTLEGFQFNLGDALITEAEVLIKLNNLDAASERLERSVAGLSTLAANAPTASNQEALARAYLARVKLADAQSPTTDASEDLALAQKAIQLGLDNNPSSVKLLAIQGVIQQLKADRSSNTP